MSVDVLLVRLSLLVGRGIELSAALSKSLYSFNYAILLRRAQP
jgi:hypothetical protein